MRITVSLALGSLLVAPAAYAGDLLSLIHI